MKKIPYIYNKLAEKLILAIKEGVYTEGQRMPSLRHTCDQYSVSMATALKAYTVLENENYFITRPRSGCFVRQRADIVPPQPGVLELTDEPHDSPFCEESRRLSAALATPGLYHFGNIASPCPSLIPAKTLARHLGRVAREDPSAISQYTSVSGEIETRSAIAKKMIDAGCTIAPEEIIVTVGCQEALVVALSATTKKGDIVAMESPIYIGITHLLESLELRSIEIPTHPEFGPDLKALEHLLHKSNIKAFISIPTCQNPLGGIMPEHKKQQMVELLARFDIPLIEDDAMGDLVYERPRPVAAKSFDKKGNVLYCSSFSKTLGTGHRIGWLVPGRFFSRAQFVKGVTSLSPPIFSERTLTSFLQSNTLNSTVNKASLEYQNRMLLLRKWVLE